MILAEDLIKGNIERWKAAIATDGTKPDTLDKVAHIVRQMVAEKNTKLPMDSILVYPFPGRIDGGDSNVGLSGVACELTIGEEVYLASEEIPRPLSEPHSGSGSSSTFFSIEPGELAVLITYEYVYLPREVMGLLSLRNTYKQRGLINISGFQVDPGFHGRLIFIVYNAGPTEIALRFRERIFMLSFVKVEGSPDFYKFGDTKAQETSSGKDLLMIPTPMLAPLSGQSVSPRSLDKRLQRLETIISVLFIPLTAGLIIALISLLVRH